MLTPPICVDIPLKASINKGAIRGTYTRNWKISYKWRYEQVKIGVCGKGGSGKSAVTALLANEALHRSYRVLVVDSDESMRVFSG